MVLGISKSYTPASGQIANSTSYNTDIAALFNAFSGLEGQTASLGGLTITPAANSLTTFKVTNAAGTSIFAINTTGGVIVLPTTSRYFVVSCMEMTDSVGTTAYVKAGGSITTLSDTAASTLYAGVHLPNAAVVTSLKVYWYRDDASAAGTASLISAINDGTETTMATADSDKTTGNHSVEDTTISGGTIDNTTKQYYLQIGLDPNNSKNDVHFYFAVITYTITTPLP